MCLKTIAALCLAPLLLVANPTTPLDPPDVMLYAQDALRHTGFLRKADDGLVYLEVQNTYITSILPLLKNPAIQPPPYLGPTGIGAHISVVLPGEVDWSKAPQFPAWGTQIPFNITHFVSVTPDAHSSFMNNKHVVKLYLFTLEAPALASLRLIAGLDPFINNEDFHITVGVEYAPEPTPNK